MHADSGASVRAAAPDSGRSCRVERRVGEQDGLARAAGLVDAELPADHVRAELGHPAERRRLAAGDRDEPLDAVVHGVIDRLEGARELAARVRVVLANRSAGGRPTTPRGTARRATAGISFAPSVASCAARGPRERRGRRGPRPSTSWCRRPRARAAGPRCRRHRTVQPVHHHVAEPAAHREHHAGRGPDRHVDPGHVGHLLRPRTGRVDDEVGADRRLASRSRRSRTVRRSPRRRAIEVQ